MAAIGQFFLVSAHLAFKFINQHINRRVEILCERVYCPWSDMEAVMSNLKNVFVWQ